MFPLINNAVMPVINLDHQELRRIALAKGEKFYFSGKKCKNNHLVKRYAHNDTCFQCHKECMKRNYNKYYLKNKYDLTEEKYDDILAKQNYLCAICKQKETTIDAQTKEIKRMSVDHCHDTGKIRGILCNNCNQGIGKFKHNSEFLKAAALYCEEA